MCSCEKTKQSVIANTDIALCLLRLIFADVSIIQVLVAGPDQMVRSSGISPVILQGNGRRLSVHLELLDSGGRVGGLHHHPGLLVGQGSSLGSQGGLLGGDPAHSSTGACAPTIGSSRGCGELDSSGQRPDKN